MDESFDPGFARDPCQPRRPKMMHPLEGLPTALGEDADAVDHRFAASNKSRQQLFIINREIDCRDLPDQAERHQEPGALRIAAADRDHVAASGKPLNDIAADKARPAKHRGSATSHLSPR